MEVERVLQDIDGGDYIEKCLIAIVDMFRGKKNNKKCQIGIYGGCVKSIGRVCYTINWEGGIG